MILSKNRVVANRHEIPFFVCSEHEEKLRKSQDRSRRYGFLPLTFALVISAIIALYLDKYVWSLYLVQTYLAIVGLKFVVFPYGLGVPGSISIATCIKLQRIMGGIILALTVIAFALMCRASYLQSLASDLASYHR